MNTRMELGRIAGIPIYLDMMFVLVMLVFSSRYFTGGDIQMMSAGLLIIAGFCVSVLLHELGHAFVARIFKTDTREIVLTGLGGIAQFSSSLPRAVLPRVAIYVAGPFVNFLLWHLCNWLGGQAFLAGKPIAGFVAFNIASANYWLMLFNMLPAYPLDGGQALDAILCRVLGPLWGERIVSVLGLLVTAGLAFVAIQSLPGSIFLLFVVFYLFEANWYRFQNAGGGFRRY